MLEYFFFYRALNEAPRFNIVSVTHKHEYDGVSVTEMRLTRQRPTTHDIDCRKREKVLRAKGPYQVIVSLLA